MTPDRNTSQVTLEQLLRLKRAERPAPEFWHQFEREMRVKQLAAIVEPRPWWAPFIRIGTKVARYQLPVGATAILALTFLTVQEYQQPSALDAQYSPSSAITKIDTMPGPSVAVTLPETHADNDALTPTDSSSANNGSAAILSSRPTAMATADQDVSVLVPMLTGGSALQDAYSPAARVIAANLAAVKANTPELVQMVERASGMEALISPRTKSQLVDPLARVKTSTDSRRSSRLLASALPAVNYAAEDSSRGLNNRVDRSLTEERLYDSISRFGVKADRVAIKF
jgi:hypothetical protein